MHQTSYLGMFTVHVPALPLYHLQVMLCCKELHYFLMDCAYGVSDLYKVGL